jgi:hypothetical protein
MSSSSLHEQWLRSALDAQIPVERRATCDKCVMCTDNSESVHASFLPSAKCCTYWPTLPNYLVGLALADVRGPEGAARLRTLIERSWAVPLGLSPSPGYKILYAQASKDFGKSLLLRCPFFIEDAGHSCSIWNHRNAVCSTWFCRFDAGAEGRAFWEAVRLLLTAAERAVATWCALQLDISPDAIRMSKAAFSSDDLERQSIDGCDKYGLDSRLWGRWNEARSSYYIRCGELASTLSWQHVLVIGGIEVQAFESAMRTAYDAMMSPRLPETVKVGPLKVINGRADHVTVVSYSEMDPQQIDWNVFAGLTRCNDRQTVDEFRGCMQRLSGVELTDSALRQLVRTKVLV